MRVTSVLARVTSILLFETLKYVEAKILSGLDNRCWRRAERPIDRQPLHCPVAENCEHSGQVLSRRGEVVSRGRVSVSSEHADLLEMSEPTGERVIRNRQRLSELLVSICAGESLTHNEHRPSIPEQGGGVPNWAMAM